MSMKTKQNMAYTVCHAPITMTSQSCLLPQQLRVHTDVKLMSLRHPNAKAQKTTVDDSIFAMVTDLWRHLIYISKGAMIHVYSVCHAPLELYK